MAKNIKKQVQKQKDVSYSNRDFESLRNNLKSFVSTYYRDVLLDTSDASLAGMLIDVAAYVGDVTSFYLDHQFNENSIENAVETRNIERLVREAGVQIKGKAPALGFLDISLVIPSLLREGEYIPDPNKIPKIKAESIFTARNGTKFYLPDDIDFAEVDSAGDLLASFSINQTSGGNPVDFLLTRRALVISSKLKTKSVSIPDSFKPFRTIQIDDADATEIVRVVDSDGEEYYEVDSLTQSTVFARMPNNRLDSHLADERIKMVHAPRRFVATRSATTGQFTLLFGSGNEDVFDEDVIPDPSEHAIKLYGDKKSLNKITIDPNSFLGTQTLGISPRNTTLTINYRSGGGLSHNVGVSQVTTVTTLITEFPAGMGTTEATLIRASATCNNPKVIVGGEDEPSIESLRQIALLNTNSQNRVVSREDLLARVYSLPNNFGRIFRAAVRDNPNNPQAAQLFVLSRDSRKALITSSDTLKENLSKYLSKFRIISDAIDILDASIINIGVNYTVTIKQSATSSVVITSINSKLSNYFKTDNFQIDQPIRMGEVENLILNTPDVEAITSLSFVNKTGTIVNNVYSSYSYDPARHIDRGYLFPPIGGMFELKYPNDDIIGRIS